jgi:hypothetical protein
LTIVYKDVYNFKWCRGVENELPFERCDSGQNGAVSIMGDGMVFKRGASRRSNVISCMFAAFCSGMAWFHPAFAQCALPYTIANGQPTDATQVMANFNALLACINNAPAGSLNALQYNAGPNTFSGVGPLTNGQLAIGSTGSPPQAKSLTAGAGISITNGAGDITISATGGGSGGGLYRQVISGTPTSAGTGLTNWLNQGSATVSDSITGLTINAPNAVTSDNITGRYMASPPTPYRITVLIAATRNSNSYNNVGIGWYNGSNKLHLLSYILQNGNTPFIEFEKWNSVTSWNSNDFGSSFNSFSQPIWLQIADDGTTISVAFSQDGANFLQVYSVAKSSGWLGASGYSNIIFFTNPRTSQTLATLMSWTQN